MIPKEEEIEQWRKDLSAEDALEFELNNLHMTGAQFECPWQALDTLIQWHVSMAVDPTVNGGYALVPVEDDN